MTQAKKGWNAVKNILKVFTLVVFLLSLLMMTVFSADNPINLNIKSIEGSSDVLIQVSVTGLNAVSRASIKITDKNGNLNFVDTFYVDAEGITEFKYVNEGDTGEYTAVVYVDELGLSETVKFDYYSSTYWDDMLNEFKDLAKNGTSVGTYWERLANVMEIDFTVYESLTAPDKADTILYQYVNTVGVNDIESLVSRFYDAVLCQVINERHSANLFAEKISNEKYADIVDVLMYNEKSVYYLLSDNGKNGAINDIVAKNYDTLTQLYDEIEKDILVNGVYYATHYNDVKTLLTAYKDVLNINPSKYSGKTYESDVFKNMMGIKYSDLNAVESAFSNYSPKVINQGGGGSGGGISLPAVDLTQPTKLQTEGQTVKITDIFDDIELEAWAHSYIQKVVDKKIINGYGNNKFAPNEYVDRAQAVTMIARLLNLEEQAPNRTFTDVSQNDWYYPYVGAVVNTGIFNGVSDTYFAAKEPISRQEICTAIWRVLEKMGYQKYEGVALFTGDGDQVADWAKEAVYSLATYGIVNGRNSSDFAPTEGLARAEAAAIFARLSDLNIKFDSAN